MGNIVWLYGYCVLILAIYRFIKFSFKGNPRLVLFGGFLCGNLHEF